MSNVSLFSFDSLYNSHRVLFPSPLLSTILLANANRDVRSGGAAARYRLVSDIFVVGLFFASIRFIFVLCGDHESAVALPLVHKKDMSNTTSVVLWCCKSRFAM
jgi:hypothetical protein